MLKEKELLTGTTLTITWIKMGIVGTLISIALIVLMILAGLKVGAEIIYSYKHTEVVDGEETTCYFDRGWFNPPKLKICSESKSITIEKEER